ncbi:MAG TPA: hypothetical protein PLT27_11020, partial [Nitrospira sp.]|nr:hypothetical protein [Nitrospira sp.]
MGTFRQNASLKQDMHTHKSGSPSFAGTDQKACFDAIVQFPLSWLNDESRHSPGFLPHEKYYFCFAPAGASSFSISSSKASK